MSKILTPKDSTEVKEKMFYIFIIFSKNKDTDTAFQFNSKKTNHLIKIIIIININYCIKLINLYIIKIYII